MRYAHLAPQHLQAAVNKLDGWGRDSANGTDTKTDTGVLPHSEVGPVERTQTFVQ